MSVCAALCSLLSLYVYIQLYMYTCTKICFKPVFACMWLLGIHAGLTGWTRQEGAAAA